MNKNNEPKKKKKSGLILKVIGVILLLAIAAATMILVLLKIKENAVQSHIDALGPASSEISEVEEEKEDTEELLAEAISVVSVVEEELPVEEPGLQPKEAEAEDGSGAAGLMPIDERIGSLECSDGWFRDHLNSWYSPDLTLCYYNGWETIGDKTYHFDKAGMIDKGWKLIGGKGCYFDNDGVYKEDADPNKLLAFTFDDGPSEGTGQLLDLAEQTGARITFFLVGNITEGYGETIQRVVNDRCLLGSHSLDHTQMIQISTEDCVSNFHTSDDLIRQVSGGIDTQVYRFPYGDFTPEQTAAIGKPSIMWSLDSLDWDLKDTQKVIDRVLEQVEEGDIILMHDLYGTTIDACRYLFPYLIEQGYQLVTVKELAAAKGFELEAGKTYYSFNNDLLANGHGIQ